MDMRPEHDGYFGTLVYDPLSDTWTMESEPRLLTEQVHVARDLRAAKSWDECVRLGRRTSESMKRACVHNGQLVVFSTLSTISATSHQWGGGDVYRWAHERAADGSWSSSRVRGRGPRAFVSESVLLG